MPREVRQKGVLRRLQSGLTRRFAALYAQALGKTELNSLRIYAWREPITAA
jgi:hypothetical protein